MLYRSKRDLWASISWVAGALIIVVGMALGILYVSLRDPPGPLLLVAPALIVLGALNVWLLHSAWYEITATGLIAHLGPFRKEILLEAIVAVDP